MQKVVIQIEAHVAPSGCKHETLLKNNMYMKRQAANVDIAQWRLGLVESSLCTRYRHSWTEK